MAKTLTPPKSPEEAASVLRVNQAMDAAASDVKNTTGKVAPDIVLANNVKSGLREQFASVMAALAPLIDRPTVSSMRRQYEAEALRHNNQVGTDLLGRIDDLDNVPEEVRQKLKEIVLDTNTVAPQSFAKNTVGPFQKIGNVIGQVGGVVGGVASGNPLEAAAAVMGHGVLGKAGGAVGALGDRLMGTSTPTVRLQALNAVKVLRGAGIDPATATSSPSVSDVLNGIPTPPPPAAPVPPGGIALMRAMQAKAAAQQQQQSRGAAPGGYDPETGLPPDPVPVNTPLGRLRIDTPADVRMAVSQDASQPATAPVAPPAAHLPGTAYIASGDPRITPAVAVRAAQAAEAAGHVPPGTAASVASSTAPINPAIARMIQPHAQAMANDAFPLPEASQTAAKRIYNPLSYRLAAEAYHAKAEAYATAHPAQANAVRHISQIVDPAGKAAEAAKYPGVPFPEWLLNPGNRA